jgi:hypothetical protein
MSPRCTGCKERITKGEPDLILRRMSDDNPTRTVLRLVFHERCKDAALERATEPPALWLMTHRYIEAGAN